MNFDELIERRGTDCSKWDKMEALYGVSPKDGIPMWVADMDFRAGEFLQDAVRGLLDKANYGYFTGDAKMKEAVTWWMKTRHGWDADPSAMMSTYGLGNAIGLCLQAYSDPEDEVVIFTPVYHEFTAKVKKSGRTLKESPLVIRDGVYHMDLETLETQLSGREKIVLFCSPHNPAGRIWTREELKELADFCLRHELLLISDEIHHDLVFPGQKHVPLPVAAPQISSRLIMLTSASKTFNTAGSRLGTVTIEDDKLRAPLASLIRALDMSPHLLGTVLTEAAYSPAGAEWVDALTQYLDENHKVFLRSVNAIPGLSAMPMQSTYLAWVDFTNTGMEMTEVLERVKGAARIAPSIGSDFGTGGESYLRFNIATPRVRVEDAVERLQAAFADLQ